MKRLLSFILFALFRWVKLMAGYRLDASPDYRYRAMKPNFLVERANGETRLEGLKIGVSGSFVIVHRPLRCGIGLRPRLSPEGVSESDQDLECERRIISRSAAGFPRDSGPCWPPFHLK